MRITSGTYRGRVLVAPEGDQTHPMGDREKLALFNRIAPSLPGSRVLDLYCGSGALGLESLSRGALDAVFVDNSKKATSATLKNAESLGLSPKIINSKVQNLDFQEKFDIIFADPPYDNFHPEELANIYHWLTDDGIFVLSHPDNPPELPNLALDSTKSYAKANISIYKHKH